MNFLNSTIQMFQTIAILLLMICVLRLLLGSTFIWLQRYLKLKNSGVPCASFYFLTPQLNPLSKFFQSYQPETRMKEVLEIFDETKSKFVHVVDGEIHSVYVKDKDIVKDIFKRSKEYTKPVELYEFFKYFGENVLTAQGSEWNHQRSSFNGFFTQERFLKVYTSSVHKYANKFMDLFIKKHSNSLTIG
jgi:cytochrome P450